ncbi:MAG: GNAT family N-acetyltransferase [Actinomycetota bacterium]
MPPLPRVRLEPLRADHAAALFGWFADAGLYRYVDESPPPSHGWLRDRFSTLAGGAPDGVDEVWLNWAVLDERDVCVGTVQATIRSDAPTAIAYMVAAAHHGRGIGRAAVDRMLDLLVVEHGVAMVEAEIDPGNDRSIRLVESLGFVPVGTVRSDWRYVRRLA